MPLCCEYTKWRYHCYPWYLHPGISAGTRNQLISQSINQLETISIYQLETLSINQLETLLINQLEKGNPWRYKQCWANEG